MIKEKEELFKDILSKFENEEFRLYCIDMIMLMPNYIFHIPSSTSQKYHNLNQRTNGGQLRHLLMVGTIMNYILDLEFVRKHIKNSKKRDCMRIAALLHDAVKCGWGSGFTDCHTKHEHPLLSGSWVELTNVDNNISLRWKKYISKLIKSHSGQWTESKYSYWVLPKPKTWEQFLVHLSDYLGSRSNLDMVYSNEEKELIDKLVGRYLC